ncbi:hypothetical protein IEO21_03213 [Rhodonia placenta]|uniref:Uncharacterized protein n=1 Tax=Rhodonia placenta TaxID=104341 RepID=A0A8H7P644_9APHY|nr:hypothetical protein IEO21_03213 [Postia placenta]
MRSLDEMRNKVIELTDEKVNLAERVDGLEGALQNRDSTIAQLESTVEELRNEQDLVRKECDEVAATLEKERAFSNQNSSELQQAYTEMQHELEETRKFIQELEAERTNYHEMADHHFAEVNRLTSTLESHMDQLSSLRHELEERERDESEVREFLERAQGETEALRAELAAKNDELERLRVAASTPTSPGQHSLDEEMLSALKQQHILELSAAQSHIRTLETSVFQAEANAHALQKQITALEDQLVHVRSSSRTSQRSPVPHRPSSRPVDYSDELRRASFASHKPSHLATPISSTFEGLSSEALHKRRVSLSMLKARIDSEVAASSATTRSFPKGSSPTTKTAALSTVVEPSSSLDSPRLTKKLQFMDESHIFWCHCCQGDLVIL